MESKIEGVKILNNFLFNDIRGSLLKVYSSKDEFGPINNAIKEIWFTTSKKDVIRGMHMQVGNSPAHKLITVIKGSILDVIIDLRKDSNTYGVYESRYFNDSNSAIILPPGVAHGYKTFISETIVMYMSDKIHSPGDDSGILFNSFGFDWKIENPIISKRDLELQRFHSK
jgi:dTDP-4-dehydrorhamnose 3,5-epimerase/CDP-3, 6-dideoxy-D-glycero-D-glycero-4-hexulose-5-epimerase